MAVLADKAFPSYSLEKIYHTILWKKRDFFTVSYKLFLQITQKSAWSKRNILRGYIQK